jgi:hypothetical protein
MTRFTFRLLAAVAAVALSASVACADPITIDNFNNPAVNTAIGLPATNYNAGAISGDLGGNLMVGFNPTLANVGGNSASIGGGNLSVFTGTSGIATTLNYSFSGGPLDFSGLTNLFVDFSFVDGGVAAGLPISVKFLTTGGDVTASAVAADSPGGIQIPFGPGDFTNFAALSGVTGLSITFNGGQKQGADFVLTKISANGEGGVFDQGDPEVPEPASLILFGGLTLGGLAFARRKLSRRTATV